VKGRQRPLSADAARLYTALTRNTLERRALTAQRDTLIREALNAGYRYADIADALGCTASTAWRIAHGAPIRQIRHDMWSDDDWRSLTREAQHLYMMLLSDPKLDYCGVTTWHPGKLAQRSGETTGADILIAGAELANRYFIVIDEETEEVLVRSYLRHDPIMKHPKLSVTVTKDFAVVGSKKIRAVIVHELQRLKRENPDWTDVGAPVGADRAPAERGVRPDMPTDLPIGAATYLGVTEGALQGVGLGMGQAVGTANGDNAPRGALQQEQQREHATGTKTEVFAPSQTDSYPQPATVFRRRGEAS
jgi:hypothetical protein